MMDERRSPYSGDGLYLNSSARQPTVVVAFASVLQSRPAGVGAMIIFSRRLTPTRS